MRCCEAREHPRCGLLGCLLGELLRRPAGRVPRSWRALRWYRGRQESASEAAATVAALSGAATRARSAAAVRGASAAARASAAVQASAAAQASASGGPAGRSRGAAVGAGRGGRGGVRGVVTSALSAPGRTRGRAARAESSAVRRGPPCGCLDGYPSRSRRFGNSCDEFCSFTFSDSERSTRLTIIYS